MKSWKIGAIAGLIAGIVLGIIWFVTSIIQLIIGLPHFGLPPPPDAPISLIASLMIGMGIVIGSITGIIYSKVLDVIPGKNVLKGIIFGLFLYSIFNLRFVTIEMSYSRISTATAFSTYFFGWIAFGLTLGILYKVLSKRYHVPKGKKVIEYGMLSGLLPGAIAGLVGGMATFITIIIGIIIGFWAWIPEQIMDIGFLISQFGAQTFFHFVWCTFMGIVFPKVYNLIPGKSVLKGFYYGLITFVITEGFAIPIALVYYYHLKPQAPLVAGYLFFMLKQLIFLGLTVWIVFGIVLGLLYRKPPK